MATKVIKLPNKADHVGLLVTKAQAKVLYICLLKVCDQTPKNYGRLSLTKVRDHVNKQYPDIKLKGGECLGLAHALGEFWNEDN